LEFDVFGGKQQISVGQSFCCHLTLQCNKTNPCCPVFQSARMLLVLYWPKIVRPRKYLSVVLSSEVNATRAWGRQSGKVAPEFDHTSWSHLEATSSGYRARDWWISSMQKFLFIGITNEQWQSYRNWKNSNINRQQLQAKKRTTKAIHFYADLLASVPHPWILKFLMQFEIMNSCRNFGCNCYCLQHGKPWLHSIFRYQFWNRKQYREKSSVHS
jgi:hypothetical protein